MRGATPTTKDFEELLYRGALCQFMVKDRRTNESHGLVAAYNTRFDNGTAYVALQRVTPGKGHGEVTEGLSYFIEYLFQTWNFRKLYAEIPAYNLDQIVDDTSLLLQEEGRLVEHEYHADRWWDLVTLAIYREGWREFYSPWMRELGLNGISDSMVYMGERSQLWAPNPR
jgi:RimJ/RimL family protein N-acetyltransferase